MHICFTQDELIGGKCPVNSLYNNTALPLPPPPPKNAIIIIINYYLSTVHVVTTRQVQVYYCLHIFFDFSNSFS